jgi:hypothetical protein
MARPRIHGKRVSTALRLPIELHERLATVAAERDTSINHLMVKAADHYLSHVLRPLPGGTDVDRWVAKHGDLS